jgi:hypothetical protein
VIEVMTAGVLCGALALTAEPLTVRVVSGADRVPLVELFTSEGCSSCPPAEVLLSRLGAGDGVLARLLPLSFHVTYWDHIGWHDRFASPRFDLRQRAYAVRIPGAGLYTPQMLIDGAEWRPGSGAQLLERELGRRRQEPPGATLALTATYDAGSRAIALSAQAGAREGGAGASPGAALVVYLVVFERRLETAVGAGENTGRTLKHDFVVRWLSEPAAWSGEASSAEATARVPLGSGWKPHDLGAAAFVQDAVSLRVEQSVATMVGIPRPGVE